MRICELKYVIYVFIYCEFSCVKYLPSYAVCVLLTDYRSSLQALS
jgi:hypothetical protein